LHEPNEIILSWFRDEIINRTEREGLREGIIKLCKELINSLISIVGNNYLLSPANPLIISF